MIPCLYDLAVQPKAGPDDYPIVQMPLPGPASIARPERQKSSGRWELSKNEILRSLILGIKLAFGNDFRRVAEKGSLTPFFLLQVAPQFREKHDFLETRRQELLPIGAARRLDFTGSFL